MELKTKECKWCFNSIDIRAKVCPHCQRGFGNIASVNVLTPILALIVSFVGIWLTYMNLQETKNERALAEKAARIANEAIFALEEPTATSIEQELNAIIGEYCLPNKECSRLQKRIKATSILITTIEKINSNSNKKPLSRITLDPSSYASSWVEILNKGSLNQQLELRNIIKRSKALGATLPGYNAD